MINLYQILYPRCLLIWSPLTKLTESNKNQAFDWTLECQTIFDEMKNTVAQDTLLVYPKYMALFEVHMDTNNLQIGGDVFQ